ncbi:hypothetical protein HK102_012106 [Quaeritorhiza haematococci]|nr:hypothetical protein HK102_012106 [Quaeritorhiza haematococci]
MRVVPTITTIPAPEATAEIKQQQVSAPNADKKVSNPNPNVPDIVVKKDTENPIANVNSGSSQVRFRLFKDEQEKPVNQCKSANGSRNDERKNQTLTLRDGAKRLEKEALQSASGSFVSESLEVGSTFDHLRRDSFILAKERLQSSHENLVDAENDDSDDAGMSRLPPDGRKRRVTIDATPKVIDPFFDDSQTLQILGNLCTPDFGSMEEDEFKQLQTALELSLQEQCRDHYGNNDSSDEENLSRGSSEEDEQLRAALEASRIEYESEMRRRQSDGEVTPCDVKGKKRAL